MCQVSCGTCHMSSVTCHVSHVIYHMSRITKYIYTFFLKEVKLVGGGFVINRATPYSFFLFTFLQEFKNISLQLTYIIVTVMAEETAVIVLAVVTKITVLIVVMLLSGRIPFQKT